MRTVIAIIRRSWPLDLIGQDNTAVVGFLLGLWLLLRLVLLVPLPQIGHLFFEFPGAFLRNFAELLNLNLQLTESLRRETDTAIAFRIPLGAGSIDHRGIFERVVTRPAVFDEINADLLVLDFNRAARANREAY